MRSFARLVPALVLGCLVLAGVAFAADGDTGSYAYYFKGRLVSLSPSTELVALPQASAAAMAAVRSQGLTQVQGRKTAKLEDRGYALYRLPAAGKDKSAALSVSRTATRDTLLASAEAQPVFDQGWALLVPCERLVVGFDAAATADEALACLGTAKDELGILTLDLLRPKTFAATISSPADGRAFAVAKALSQVDGVRFAEPDQMVVWQRELAAKTPAATASPLSLTATSAEAIAAAARLSGAEPAYRTAERGASPSWLTVASADAESAALPSGWSAGAASGYAAAYWGRTSQLAHSGAWSYYCAKSGGKGQESPGPAPANMGSYLYFLADFSGYEEAYVEFWFYAKNEVTNGYAYDYGYVILWDADDTTSFEVTYLLNNGLEGDMTADATTQNGWRRCLLRVPPALRKADVGVEIDWISDGTTQTEGLYVDDVRVLGSSDVDTEPLGSDTFAGRQYEISNAGQVAGLGASGNDLNLVEAWNLAASSTVTVAVVDDGADLTHPDLNLVQGYDWDGSAGGAHKSLSDMHGTACAGNVGAVANAVGVRGTAPGVPIMPVEALSSALTDADLAAGIDVAVSKGAKVLSNSWGWYDSPVQVIVDAVRDAVNAGCSVLFSAGNGPDRAPYTYEVAFPGNQTGDLDIITVGATSPTDEYKGAASSDGQFAWGSSYVGSGPDVMAPGTWCYTTDRQGALGYNDASLLADANYDPTFAGTSAATPKVAGICALLYQVNDELYPRAVKDILMQTADETVDHDEDKSGAGRVNAYAAVRKAKLWHAPAWWWDETKPGTGLAIELQDEKAYLAWYVYDASGQPVWYASLATRSADQAFTGSVFRATGWPLGTTWDGAPTITSVGSCTLTFKDEGNATFSYAVSGLSSGSLSLTRLFDNLDGLTGHAYDPRNLSGWWWDPDLEGMGVFLEARGDTLYLAWYHYRADRSPRWWSLGGGDDIGGFPSGSATFSASLREWENGQTVGGTYRSPAYTDLSGASLTVNADGTLTLTSEDGTYSLQRFEFSQF